MGLIDEKTGIPLEVTSKAAKRLSDAQKRWLWRNHDAGVRPLVRDDYDRDYKHLVVAYYKHDSSYGVAYVEPVEALAPKLGVVDASKNTGVLVKGITLADLKILLTNANDDPGKVLETVSSERLAAIIALVKRFSAALDI